MFNQLEASFLSNVGHNFDPEEFKGMFSDCLLTKRKQSDDESALSDTSFHAVFSDTDNRLIGLELRDFLHPQKISESHQIKRLYNGQNSISFLNDENEFLLVCCAFFNLFFR